MLMLIQKCLHTAAVVAKLCVVHWDDMRQVCGMSQREPVLLCEKDNTYGFNMI